MRGNRSQLIHSDCVRPAVVMTRESIPRLEPRYAALGPYVIFGLDERRVVQARDGDIDRNGVLTSPERDLRAASSAKLALALCRRTERRGLAVRVSERIYGHREPGDCGRPARALAYATVTVARVYYIPLYAVSDFTAEATAFECFLHFMTSTPGGIVSVFTVLCV